MNYEEFRRFMQELTVNQAIADEFYNRAVPLHRGSTNAEALAR